VCGIAGILDPGAREEELRDLVSGMTEALVHRGPDSEGSLFRPGVGLGMRRLRIIDLETGEQPVFGEDGRTAVILNGEIYNFVELRERLEGVGHRFSTRSDTEVIAHLYEDEGPGFVRHLRGMFAVAVLDSARDRLVLARDRFGIKPLFVAADGSRMAFGSEIRALLALPWVELGWDACALLAYLHLGYVPAPSTAYSGIRRMEPGTVEVWDRVSTAPVLGSTSRWWRPSPAGRFGGDLREASARLLDLLRESVSIHLRSDVPLGAFLSGGMDSSAVVAAMRLCGAGDIRTFTIGFDTPGFDETHWARRAAAHLGTMHTERILTDSEAAASLDAVMLFDEPFADSSAIPTLLVSRLAREQVTVSLSGDGGDELFAGYSQYGRARLYRIPDLLPRPVARSAGRALAALAGETGRGAGFFGRLGAPVRLRHLSLVSEPPAGLLMDSLSPAMRAFLGEGACRWEERYEAGPGLLERQLVDQATYLPDDILVKVDRCSMAVSLEARVPLLDHVLAEFANSLPDWMKLSRNCSKRELREAVAPLLPPGFLDRPKRGFAIPLRRWLGGCMRERIGDLLLSDATGLLDAGAASRLLDSVGGGGRDVAWKVWRLYCLAAWAGGAPGGRPW